MSDAQTPTHSKVSSDTRRNGGGSRHNSEADSSSATPSATRGKSDCSTPARPGSALSVRLANSTPRLRSRPAPLRPLSTPLGRSLSMRVSKKEKRWSLRLADPKSPQTSTYQDDYQSPEALSLQSLNLETTTERGSNLDLNAQTTYRESYKWQRPRSGNKGQLKSENDDKDTPNRNSNKSAVSSDRRVDGFTSSDPVPISPIRTASGTSQASQQTSHTHEQPSSDRPVIQSPTSARSLSFFRRNASSGVIQSRHNGQSLSSTDMKSPASSSKDSFAEKPAREKGVSITKPANGNTLSANGEGLQNPGTPQAQKLTNGVRGQNVPISESKQGTPRRIRAYQLQSSNGGSPFAYGSDSGSGV